MKATSVTWRRTFPDSAPGTDGVAIFEGRVIGRVRQDEHCAGKPWLWSVTDPELAGKPGCCRLRLDPDLPFAVVPERAAQVLQHLA
jgi:hypothetical protein